MYTEHFSRQTNVLGSGRTALLVPSPIPGATPALRRISQENGPKKLCKCRPDLLVVGRRLLADGLDYEIADLTDLRRVRGDFDPIAVCAAILAIIVVVADVMVLSQKSSFGDLMTVAAATVLPLISALVVCGLRRRRYELHACYRGAPVTLVTEANQEIFDVVCHEMRRVIDRQLSTDATTVKTALRTSVLNPGLPGPDALGWGRISRNARQASAASRSSRLH
jgi:hypothetical protein